MITICTRCRVPYARPSVLVVGQGSEAWCTECRAGRSADVRRPSLRPLPTLRGRDAEPATVLPVAS
ncbi:MAG: hypothetical protein LCI03_02585 [Actinobacteria bacterium]|nr:hypothetical protein [Actinomycetota bacterium]